jgi:hypothetical protein
VFNIKDKKVSQTGIVQLTDAEEAPLLGEGGKQCSIEVHGPGSAVYAKAEAKRSNKVMDRIKRKGKSKASAEEQRADQADFLADITIAFHNFDYGDDPETPLTGRALFHAVYMDREIGFITDQVQAFVGDWGNFSGTSTTN